MALRIPLKINQYGVATGDAFQLLVRVQMELFHTSGAITLEIYGLENNQAAFQRVHERFVLSDCFTNTPTEVYTGQIAILARSECTCQIIH